MTTLFDNHTWQFERNGYGDLIRYTNPAGATTLYYYDGYHNLTRIRTPDGRDTSLTYDTSDRVTAVIDGLASNSAASRSTYAYSAPTAPCLATDKAKTVVTNPNGTTTTYCFDATRAVTYPADEVSDQDASALDQSGRGGSDVTEPAPASATPIDGGGGSGAFAASATTPTETWRADEVDNDTGLRVLSATAAGTYALTGVVIREDTGAAVSGATVTLSEQCSGCQLLTATSNASGAFAFVNVRIGTSPRLTVQATGFGTYTLNNLARSSNETYQATIALRSSPKTYDDSARAGDGPPATAAQTSGYDSAARVPPEIAVAEWRARTGDCDRSGDAYDIRRYRWPYYVLHVMKAEIQGAFPSPTIATPFHRTAAKAMASAIQNYGWFYRRNAGQGRAPTGADVDNTNTFQCFTHGTVPNKWRRWVRDVINERIVASDGSILEGKHLAGTYDCTEGGVHAPDGGTMSQLGAKRLDEECGFDNWRSIAEYYYAGDVRRGKAPPRSRTSFVPITGGVELRFPSRVDDSQVAWTYRIDAKETSSGAIWRTQKVVRWSRQTARDLNGVATSFRFGDDRTLLWRVRPCNAVGCAPFVVFNNGQPITPDPRPG
ncbi:MAG TPA: carboxypeptidase regulatory-like domain-containing protein [Solirubrobacteraceae bacterium]|jgi:YD repeat-containing protein